jgi:hypothetical protein
LSICYEQVLDNLAPGHENDSRIMGKQQDQICRWLMKDVPAAGWVKGLIESQHNGSASLAAAVGSSVAPSGDVASKFAVVNRPMDDGKVNRMELTEALMEEYFSAKHVWEWEHDAMRFGKVPNFLMSKVCRHRSRWRIYIGSRRQINAKSRLLDTLQARLATLQLAPKNDLKALQSAVEQAQSAYNKAQSDLQKTYTSNIVTRAKLCIRS